MQDTDQSDAKGSSPGKPVKLHLPKNIVDCFTGRYVYEAYMVWRQEARRQHERALAAEEHAHSS